MSNSANLDLNFESFRFHISTYFQNSSTLLKANWFGFILNGSASFKSLVNHEQSIRLGNGMYFSCNSDYLCTVSGEVLVIESMAGRNLNVFGGPIENQGRLKYIDGCRDTLLIPPVMKGEPCLNALFFPPQILQTKHTHPSFRIGVVIEGSGRCILEDEAIDLMPGQFFFIPQDTKHCFHSSQSGLKVIAFHPDSDFGPTDEIHPMINKTII